MSNQNSNQKYIQMTQTPVEKLIIQLAIPSIISMLVTTIYNAADTFFVGQISTSSSAAVGVCFSMMSIIQALGFFFGQGAGSSISRALGNQQGGQASEMASVGFFSAIIFGSCVTVLGLAFIEPLVYLLGATDTIYPHAVEYLSIILVGAPIVAASFVLNNLLRFQGYSFYGMIGVTVGGVLNVALDPLFMFVLDMGTAGAALATVVSQGISLVVLFYLNNRHSAVKIKIKNFRPRIPYFGDIIRGGLPSLLRQSIASVAVICLNLAAKPYGDAALAAISIVSKITMFTNSALLVFGQGFQPVCGFNYGARLYDRVRKGYFFCVKYSFLFLTTLAVIEFFCAGTLIGVFRDDPQVVEIGTLALRLQCLSLPTFSIIVISNMMLQTSGKVVAASLVGSARQGFFLIPSVFILPPLFGLLGIQMAQPIADFATFLMTVPLARNFLREMKQSTD